MAPRRELHAERAAAEDRREAQSRRTLGTIGDPPPNPFGGLPVSEIAILAGIVSLIVGLINGGGPAVIVGAVVCGLGVAEFSVREHFSGYRSHAILLAAIPAVLAEVLWATLVGTPGQPVLLLGPAILVFLVCFVPLRRSFQSARHARVVKPPSS